MARRKRSNNEGSIYFSSGLWTAQVSLPDGTRKKKRSKRQSVVREWLDKEREAVRGGIWVSGYAVKVEDFINRYLEEVALHTLRPATYLNYRHQLKNRARPYIGDIKIANLRPEHLQKMYSDLLKTVFQSRLSEKSIRFCVRS